MLIAIKADYAKRVYSCASNEETRYYLCGFAVYAAQCGTGVDIVATDGRVLSAFHDDAGAVEPGSDNHVIVQLTKAELKACGATSRDDRERWLVVEGDRDHKSSTLAIVFAATAAEAIEAARVGNPGAEGGIKNMGRHFIDGTFPDWRRVLPDSAKLVPGLLGTVNENLLRQMAASVGVKGGSPLTFFSSDAASPILVRGNGDDWLGIVMPMGGHIGDERYPAWVHSRPEAAAAA